jgi:hypothetical protein
MTQQEAGENCVMRDFIVSTAYWINLAQDMDQQRVVVFWVPQNARDFLTI